jgi:hypothetical protein
VPEGALHGDDVAAGGDQTRGVDVPEIVQSQSGDPGSRGGSAPAVADGVLVRRLGGFSSEDPAALRALLGDVGRQHLDQPGRQEDEPLAAVLRRLG